MKKQLLLTAAIALFLAGSVQAQIKVGDNLQNMNANAVFEMESASKGMLLPRLSLVETTNFAPLGAHVAGMAVYNIATVGDVTPGYYFNDGTKWVRIVDKVANIYTQSGNLSGSRSIGTGSNTLNFTGASSGAALTVNGANNNIGVGTNTPDASAIADFNSSNKGVLLPRINLQSATDGTTIAGPAKGLIIYNTNTSLQYGEGLYVNEGTSAAPRWVAVAKRGELKSFLRYKAATGFGFLTAQLLSNSYDLVKFTIAGKEFDENDEYDPSTGAFTAKQDGIYNIYVQSDSKGLIAIADYGVGIFKVPSGSAATTPATLISEEQYTNVGVNLVATTVNVSPPTRSTQTLVKLNTGDKILFGIKSPLVNLNLLTTSQTYFTIHQVK